MYEPSPSSVIGRVDAALVLLDIAERAAGARRLTLIRSVEQISRILLAESGGEQRAGREWGEAKDLLERLRVRVAALMQQ